MKSSSWVSDVLLCAGTILIVCGVALWSVPLACIVAGTFLLVFGSLIAWINHAS